MIFSELEDNNFTGIGISCGGGMCNVTLAYLSIPSMMFSISKGGDFIDESVGSVTGEQPTRVKVIKEEGLDLSKQPKDKYEKALRIYYEDLIESLVEKLQNSISQADKLPRVGPPAAHRALGRDGQAARLQGDVREGPRRAQASRRGVGRAHGLGSADRHRARSADRRPLREVGRARGPGVSRPGPGFVPRPCC